jgi:hypothetical protein
LGFNSLWVNARYILIMAVAAGVALVRGFFVAGILDVPSFGLYVTFVAAGMFSSVLLSFGENEKTIKNFPRLWVGQHLRSEVTRLADKSCQLMISRAGVVLILLLAFIFVEGLRNLAQMGIFVVLVALSAALASLYASAIRATGEIDLLARNTLLRSLIVILLGVMGAFFFNWQGAILGEVLGALLGALNTRYAVIRRTRLFDQNNEIVVRTSGKTVTSDGGFWLFLAALLASIPVYLDRAFVASVFGAAMVGTFGFLLLFVTGANTFTGIVAQKVGPHIVKMEHAGDSVTGQIKYVLRWVTVIWLVSAVGMVAVTLALTVGPAQYFFDKFNLNFNLIAATAVLCILQIGVLADFIMISRNQERALFVSACGYLMAIGVVALLVLWLKLTLVSLVWLLALSKLFHIGVQGGFIVSLWKVEKRQLEVMK